jgi:hypothetical protein
MERLNLLDEHLKGFDKADAMSTPSEDVAIQVRSDANLRQIVGSSTSLCSH